MNNWRRPASFCWLGNRISATFMKIWFRAIRRTIISGVLGLFVCVLPMPADAAEVMKENLLMVRINGIEVSDSEPVLELEPGRLFVPAGVFSQGRLRLPALHPTHVSALGLDYYPL